MDKNGQMLFEELKLARSEYDWNEIYQNLRSLKSFDEEYRIPAIRDLLVGDEVLFLKAEYKAHRGLGKNAAKQIDNYEIVRTRILSESFTGNVWRFSYRYDRSLTKRGLTRNIDAKQLWISGVWRKPWDDEEERKRIRKEKYGRAEKVAIY